MDALGRRHDRRQRWTPRGGDRGPGGSAARRSFPATARHRRQAPVGTSVTASPRVAPATPRRRATSQPRRRSTTRPGATARGIGQTIPGNDEATLVARGIDPAIATAIGSGDATTARDLATPAAPAAGSSFDLPSIDAGTAAVVGGLAGAGLLILGGAFAARRQRVTPV